MIAMITYGLMDNSSSSFPLSRVYRILLQAYKDKQTVQFVIKLSLKCALQPSK